MEKEARGPNSNTDMNEEFLEAASSGGKPVKELVIINNPVSLNIIRSLLRSCGFKNYVKEHHFNDICHIGDKNVVVVFKENYVEAKGVLEKYIETTIGEEEQKSEALSKVSELTIL